MFDTSFNEFLSFIFCLVKSNDMRHIEVFEDLKIVFWLVSSSFCFIINRTHECNEFFWNDPVKVSIFYFLIVIVLLWVKVSEVVPSKLDCDFKTLETVEDLKFNYK